MGVPSGIVPAAKDLYESIIQHMKTLDQSSADERYEFEIDKSFEIGGIKIESINFLLECSATYLKIDTPIVASFGVMEKSDMVVNHNVFIKNRVDTTPNIRMIVAVPENGWDLGMVVNLMINTKIKMISSLSHELKHWFDAQKKSITSVKSIGDYQTYSNSRFGLPPIDDFMHILYFTTEAENLVRPSELAAKIDAGEISKDQFIDFLKNDDLINNVLKLKNFSIKNLKSELESHLSEISDIISSVGGDPSELDESEMIDRMLELFFITLINNKLGTYQSMLSPSFMEMFGNGGGRNNDTVLKKEQHFNKLVVDIGKKFKNYKQFFDYQEKMITFVGNKMYRKLVKLYDMAKTNKNSIKNWDLHHKINKPKFEGFIKSNKTIEDVIRENLVKFKQLSKKK